MDRGLGSAVGPGRPPADVGVRNADASRHSLENREGQIGVFSEPSLKSLMPDEVHPARLDDGGGGEMRLGVEKRQGTEVVAAFQNGERLTTEMRTVPRDLDAARLEQEQVILGLPLGEEDVAPIDLAANRHIH